MTRYELVRRVSLRLVLASVLLAAIASCGGPRGGEAAFGPPRIDPRMPRVAPPTAEDQACSMDLECVLVQDCCGCGGGGRLQALHRDRVEALEAAASSGCSERCSATASTEHRSCSATEAVCRGGRCIPRLLASGGGGG
jgi:hypothetical protein